MSAYVPDKFHIDLMVDLAINGNRPWGDFSWLATNDTGQRIRREALEIGADGIGQMLVDEVVTSVGYRYDTPPDGDLPGPIEHYWAEPYVWQRPPFRLTPVEGLSAINCYEYQACEHDGWKTSEAKAFCEQLIHKLIHALPGYDDAPWGWTPNTKRELVTT